MTPGESNLPNLGSRRWLWWSSLAGGVAVAFTASAWPSALLLRYLLERATPERNARETRQATRVVSITDEPYGRDEPDARLDVYFPAATAADERRPTVVWVHGGAWISGHKESAAPYFELLAGAGFTVVAVEYTRAPNARYPTPIRQVNDAIAYVREHADRFHVDGERMVLAGDSAGAQIASQLAAVVTNPAYAEELAIVPALAPEQLRGNVLFCGAYDSTSVARHERPLWNALLQLFQKNVLWAYTGQRGRDSAVLRQMSTIRHATSDFPPTFISGGNADPLTDAHSRPFAARLDELGVEVTARFFATGYTPALGHEYQFDVDTADAQAALAALVEFMQRRTA